MPSPILEFCNTINKVAPKPEKRLFIGTVTNGFPGLQLVVDGLPLYSDDVLIGVNLINNLNEGDKVLIAKVEDQFIVVERITRI